MPTRVSPRFKFASPLERLEKRLMFSVSYDANGWTVVTPSVNSKIIYVSSSTGSDSNNGLSPATPIFSFKKAESLLVSGQPDEILLKAGDTFNDAFLNWVYSGQDVQDPMLVSYYQPTVGQTLPLPLVDVGTNSAGFGTPINQPSNNAAVNFVDIIGINFQANLHNPNSANFNASSAGEGTGFYFYNPGGNILLEDDTFEYFRYNMDIEALEGGAINGITVRRCVDEYAYATNYGHSQGIYAYNVSNITIVQSVFDHDGWDFAVPTSEDLGFNHDMYIASTCSGVDIEQNVIAEAAFAGVMARAGGIIKNNLFIDDAIAVAYGQANGADSKVGGVTGVISGNVMDIDKTYDFGQAYGQGFDIGNIMPITGNTGGVVVSNNIVTGDVENAKPALQLDPATGTDNPTQAVGENNVTLENNITFGYREGIETDGRFQDGVSPSIANLYAYNNVTVQNNTFLQATTYEVTHPNAWDAATESWSGDKYYDSVLSQSSWANLANSNVPFSTWISNYDIGASQLSSLSIFPNPYVSIAEYDSFIGGPGTWQDFVANADKMSIQNYQPQYLALAGINYMQEGFNAPLSTSTGTTGGSGASGPPTAAAATLNINDTALNTSSYTFIVNYVDSNQLKTASLGGGNILVTGPNGFSQYAAYLSAAPATTDSNGYQHVSATYSITAPSGAWASGQDGTYTITMLANQVYDGFGSPVPAGTIGSFYADLTPPTAVAAVTPLNITTQGSTPFGFTVSYSSPVGIDTTTLDNYSVRVTGPGNFSQYATITNTSTSTSNNNTVAVVSYAIAPAGSSWTAGTYTVSIASGTVSDLDGNSVNPGTLATFTAQAGSGSTAGTASITGLVFNDANGNGLYDTRENTLTGVTVFIDLAGTGVYAAGDPTSVTNTSGNYTFSNLSAGRYTLVEEIPTGSGLVVTTPTTGQNTVTLTAGQAATGVNFADQLSTVVLSGSGTSSNTSSGSTTSSATTGTGHSSTPTNPGKLGSGTINTSHPGLPKVPVITPLNPPGNQKPASKGR
jgi:hypothetical protein